MYITPRLKESLNSKAVAYPDAMMKLLNNQVLQEKLDLVDLKLNRIENRGILIENEIWVRFMWVRCQSSEFVKLCTNFSFIKMYHGDS